MELSDTIGARSASPRKISDVKETYPRLILEPGVLKARYSVVQLKGRASKKSIPRPSNVAAAVAAALPTQGADEEQGAFSKEDLAFLKRAQGGIESGSHASLVYVRDFLCEQWRLGQSAVDPRYKGRAASLIQTDYGVALWNMMIEIGRLDPFRVELERPSRSLSKPLIMQAAFVKELLPSFLSASVPLLRVEPANRSPRFAKTPAQLKVEMDNLAQCAQHHVVGLLKPLGDDCSVKHSLGFLLRRTRNAIYFLESESWNYAPFTDVPKGHAASYFKQLQTIKTKALPPLRDFEKRCAQLSKKSRFTLQEVVDLARCHRSGVASVSEIDGIDKVFRSVAPTLKEQHSQCLHQIHFFSWSVVLGPISDLGDELQLMQMAYLLREGGVPEKEKVQYIDRFTSGMDAVYECARALRPTVARLQGLQQRLPADGVILSAAKDLLRTLEGQKTELERLKALGRAARSSASESVSVHLLTRFLNTADRLQKEVAQSWNTNIDKLHRYVEEDDKIVLSEAFCWGSLRAAHLAALFKGVEDQAVDAIRQWEQRVLQRSSPVATPTAPVKRPRRKGKGRIRRSKRKGRGRERKSKVKSRAISRASLTVSQADLEGASPLNPPMLKSKPAQPVTKEKGPVTLHDVAQSLSTQCARLSDAPLRGAVDKRRRQEVKEDAQLALQQVCRELCDCLANREPCASLEVSMEKLKMAHRLLEATLKTALVFAPFTSDNEHVLFLPAGQGGPPLHREHDILLLASPLAYGPQEGRVAKTLWDTKYYTLVKRLRFLRNAASSPYRFKRTHWSNRYRETGKLAALYKRLLKADSGALQAESTLIDEEYLGRAMTLCHVLLTETLGERAEAQVQMDERLTLAFRSKRQLPNLSAASAGNASSVKLEETATLLPKIISAPSNPKEAIELVQMASALVRTQIGRPVIGRRDAATRTKSRNWALKDLLLYLRCVEAKLGASKGGKAGEHYKLSLLRLAHLAMNASLVAALWDQENYSGETHVLNCAPYQGAAKSLLYDHNLCRLYGKTAEGLAVHGITLDGGFQKRNWWLGKLRLVLDYPAVRTREDQEMLSLGVRELEKRYLFPLLKDLYVFLHQAICRSSPSD